MGLTTPPPLTASLTAKYPKEMTKKPEIGLAFCRGQNDFLVDRGGNRSLPMRRKSRRSSQWEYITR